MSGNLYVSNIQHFSVHDGPGIRTTVFLKGCSLHCPWCANPENICMQNQFWFDEAQCVGDAGGCMFSSACSRTEAFSRRGTVCTEDGRVDCPMGALRMVASVYSVGELLEEVMGDRNFWGDGGGVTFSGGEPLLQAGCLEPVLERLHGLGIDICFETALFADEESVRTALRYASRLYIDMKILDPGDCMRYLGGDIRAYRRNLGIASLSGIPYTVRIPLLRPYTYNERNLRLLEETLKEFNVADVELFACHNLGDRKYAMLGREPIACGNVTGEELQEAAGILGTEGRSIRILRLG